MVTNLPVKFDNYVEANIIKTRLADEGVECFLTNEHFTSLMPHYSGILGAGIQIFIHAKDFEKAAEILKLHAVFKHENKTLCPFCKSDNIKFSLGD